MSTAIPKQFDIYSKYNEKGKYTWTVSDTMSGEVLGNFDHEGDARKFIETQKV